MSHMRSFNDHFQCHLKEVKSRLRSVDPEQFLTIIEHLRSVNCTAVDFQKADLMMKVLGLLYRPVLMFKSQ